MKSTLHIYQLSNLQACTFVLENHFCNAMAGIESMIDFYCNSQSLYTDEVTENRTGN